MSDSASGEIRLLLCGDVMLGRGIDQVLPHPGEITLYEKWRDVSSAEWFVTLARLRNGPIPDRRDAGYVWGDALDDFDGLAPDLRLINLETAITARGQPWPGKAIHYRMNPRNIEVLSRARIDFCALANNHVQDWGQEGMADTIDTLRGVGIACAGAGTNRRRAAAPAILNVPCKGRVVVVSLATPCSWTPLDWAAMPDRPGVNLIDITEQSFQLLRRQLVGLRRPGDIVVVSIHWGDNFGYEIDRRHRVFAWRLIDEAKVDLVHGHSSHHVRGIEVHGGKPILYGCGDLINDYEGIPRPPGREAFLPDLGLIYLARFSTADGRFLGLQMRPTRLRRMRVQHAGDQDRRQLCDVLNREGEKFGTRVVEEDGLLSLQVGGAR